MAEAELIVHAGRATVVGHGELDILSAAALSAALADACASGMDVTLDVSDVVFLDLHALRSIEAAEERLRDEGHSLRIVGPAPIVRRLLDLTGRQALLEAG